MADVQWHRDRHRAESFGAGAAAYDRHRPPYAAAMFDDLSAPGPDGVLDIGCGNGRAAAGFVARGLDVIGVEPDERMIGELGGSLRATSCTYLLHCVRIRPPGPAGRR